MALSKRKSKLTSISTLNPVSVSDNNTFTNNHSTHDNISTHTFNNTEKTLSSSIWSDISVALTITNLLLGINIFNVPWGYQQSGILIGLVITIVISVMSCYTSMVLLSMQYSIYCNQRKNNKSNSSVNVMNYSDLTGYIFHYAPLKYVVIIATIVSCIGTCIAIMIFINNILTQFVSLPSSSQNMSSYVQYLIVALLVVLSWMRSMNEISKMTVFGVGTIIFAIALVIYDSVRTNNAASSTLSSSYRIAEIEWIIRDLGTMFNYIGPATFSFTTQYCLLSMASEELESTRYDTVHCNSDDYSEDDVSEITNTDIDEITLKRREMSGVSIDPQVVDSVSNGRSVSGKLNQMENGTNSSMDSSSNDRSQWHLTLDLLSHTTQYHRPLIMAYAFTCLFVCLFGTIGYVTYASSEVRDPVTGRIIVGCEDSVCQNIILNLHPGIARKVLGICLIITCPIGYILMLAPARAHIEGLILRMIGCSVPQSPTAETWRVTLIMNSIRASIVTFTYLISTYSPSFGTALGTVGGLSDCLQSLILPALMLLFIQFRGSPANNDEAQSKGWAFYATVIPGVGIALFGITTFLLTIISNLVE